MIAGNVDAVDRAIELLKTRGAKRAIKLNVSAPFHCDLMFPAQERLAEDLATIEFKDLRFPIIENVSAEANTSGTRSRMALTEQVTSPVRWAQSVETLLAEDVETFIEIGTGKVLSGLVRQINRDVRCLNVENTESLKEAINKL